MPNCAERAEPAAETQNTPSGYGGEAQGGWSLDCTQTNTSTCPDFSLLSLLVETRDCIHSFFHPLFIAFHQRCTARMQRKEASVRAGCWRLTLLSCVLALHLMPLPVHGKKLHWHRAPPSCGSIHITGVIYLFEFNLIFFKIIK